MVFGDKVALVTGAGSGIGRATAERLANEGAKVGLLGPEREELDHVAAGLKQSGCQAMTLAADVADPESMQRSVEALTDRWQRLDLVVANAGVNGVWAPIEQLEVSEWNQTLTVNLTGTFLTVKFAAPWLKRAGGAVVVVSSVNGTRCFSNIGASAYATSKAGQIAFMKMMALELARDGVRVNAVCPGAIDTNIDESTVTRGLDRVLEPVDFPRGGIPLTNGRSGSPDQVAKLICFLLSDSADHITGTETWIDGATSLLQG